MSDPQDDADTTAVTIYGRTYHLKGSADASYLGELAELVDARMREVVEATGTADSLKVAILAALNIADEYLQGSPPGATASGATGRRVQEMITLLDETLAG